MTAWPPLVALLFAFLTAFVLERRFGAPPMSGRFASIDGLRGYLAFSVFIHHSCIWYFYQRSGEWHLPPARLYVHLGQSSVALFFMITGFLFFSKLIRGRTKPVDWLQLYVSRVLRLLPLFACVMLTMFLIVAVLSGWQFNEPATKVVKQCIRWLSFSLLDLSNINQVPQTNLIVAGVTWSLAYEWFFYGALPLLALAVGTLPRWPYLLLGVASTLWLIEWRPLAIHLWAFGGGIAAALACHSTAMCRWASGRWASVLIVAALATAVIGFPSARDYLPLALLSAAFMLIACGNTLFGLLVHPASRLLGETAYGIYLLHGIVLFLGFHFLLGADQPGRTLSVVEHWAFVIALAPVVVLAAYGSFRIIESPAMRKTEVVTTWLRSLRILGGRASKLA